MKHFGILLSILLLVNFSNAQEFRKTNFSVPLKASVDLSKTTPVFYNSSLVHLDQHPVPYYTDFGDKKKQAQQRRAEGIANRGSTTASYKTLGIAPDPIIDTGWIANSGGTPMDNDIAVSNDGTIISAVNSNLFIFDASGTTIGIRGITGIVPFLGQFDRVSDPRLLYDPKTDRFILVCFTGNTSATTKIIIGFTTTNDPLMSWNFYELTGNPFNDSTWSDYPIISISDKDLFMTFNQIQEGIGWQNGFRQSVIYQIKKDDGYNADPLQYTLWDSIGYNGRLYRNICPAKYQENTMGDDMYFLSVRNVDVSNDSIFIMHIDDSYQSGNATMTQKVVQSPVVYGFPPNPSMNNGNYLMTNDGRVLAAIYENDYIHFGANSVHPTLGNAGVLLGEIQNVSTSTPTVNAEIFADATTEYGYPSMAYMGTAPTDHRVMFNVPHCYTDSVPGISVLYKDANGDYSDMVRVVESNNPINNLSDTNERWGDYSGIQTLYNNPNVTYLAGTYIPASTYRAWVARVSNAEWALNVPTVNNLSRSSVFPNPVKESTFTATFTLARKENLSFNLYDMQGRLIVNLMNASCKIGRNEFSFNTSVLAEGNYVFTIQSENEKVLSKIISVK
jgi:hypothetical protein